MRLLESTNKNEAKLKNPKVLVNIDEGKGPVLNMGIRRIFLLLVNKKGS